VDPSADLLADLARSAPEAAAGGDPTDDLLAGLAATAPSETPDDDPTADLLADLAASAPEERAATDQTDDPFADLAAAVPVEELDDDPTSDLLADLAASAPKTEAAADPTDDLLADLAAAIPEETPDDDPTSDLLADLVASAPAEEAEVDLTDDLLADLADAVSEETPDDDPTDDLLADLAASAPVEEAELTDDLLADLAATAPEEAVDADPTDDLLADLAATAPEATPDDDPADDPFADLAEASPVAAVEEVGALAGDDGGSAGLDDLDDLLGDLNDLGAETAPAAEASEPATEGAAGLDDLDDLLGDLGDEPAEEAAEEVGEEAGESPAEAAEAADLDDLLGDLDSDPVAAPQPAGATLTGAPVFAFGTLSSERPAAERLSRRRFRIAILGDFSGRAARGLVETGAALAARRATLLDPDTVEQIIESFATDLVLPLGQDGAGIEVRLGGLDDLHPDALFENVALFSELAGLRRQLSGGATAESAAGQLRAWGEAHGTPVAPPRRQSGGNAVRADLKLSDFQRLIGAPAAAPSPLDDLLARVVGPHIRALPDPDAAAMIGAVDRALSAAMRMLLHHPEFQSVEAQWRALDLIARSIETDDRLEVMLYDISAEEIAADLASHDDLSQSGFARLLTEAPLDPETGRGGYSALIGLYTFEETPPHAELLGRIARVAAHVDAPFLAAIGPGFLEVEKQHRHPLVAQAWDGLRVLPEAGHLGLLTPRLLLRRPYGAKTEPIYEFDFEEFTPAEGLSGLLWGNPAVLAAILLAQSFRRNGPSMDLGSVMSLGGMPYHYVTDRYGDQVALPCTERNLTQARVEFAMARGLMPVVSIKGRDEVRLASFQSLAGGEILGPWSGAPRPEPSPPEPMPAPVEAAAADLDDLLAGFAGDDPAVPLDPDAIDADLAALLDDL
ncbi:MAG: type VI secretion system contractile sheath large subunit, partial [Pseudodonghicola sp.]